MKSMQSNYTRSFAIPQLSDYLPGNSAPDRLTGAGTDASQPLVSIITAVRNGAYSVERAMSSVFAQKYPHIEYLVIDGGSVDGTVEVIHRHASRLAYYVSEPDKGISDAFNKGIAVSHGEIIGIINSDDWYEPEAVSAAVAALLASKAEVVCGAVQYWNNGGKTLVFLPDPERLCFEMTVHHPAVFVRRSVYEREGLFSLQLRYAMDYELMLRFKIQGAVFTTVNKVLANMNTGGASDHFWIQGQREVALSKTAWLGHLWRNRIYSWKAISRRIAAAGLRYVGLGRAVEWYKAKHSICRKVRTLE
jgi:glycosyltransferase involved in cell wall biosynthesis